MHRQCFSTHPLIAFIMNFMCSLLLFRSATSTYVSHEMKSKQSVQCGAYFRAHNACGSIVMCLYLPEKSCALF